MNDPVQQQLAAREAELQEIVQTVRTDTSETDGDMTIVRSGFALGWSARKEFSEGHPSAANLQVIVAAVRELDEVLASPTTPPEIAATLAGTRNTLSSCARKSFDSEVAEVAEQLTRYCGPRVAGMVMRDDPLTEDEAQELGFLASQSYRQSYFGYLLYRNEPSLKCRCLACLSSHLVKSPHSTAMVEEAVVRDFGSHVGSLPHFGRFFREGIRSSGIPALGPDGLPSETVDPSESRHAVESAFLKMMGAGKSGAGERDV